MMGTQKKNFADATEACRQSGAFLAEPRTEAINSFVKTFHIGRNFYIGLNYDDSTDQYIWGTDNSSVSYDDWGYDTPKLRVCVVMFNAHWRDVGCDAEMLYLCQAIPRKSFVVTLVSQLHYF